MNLRLSAAVARYRVRRALELLPQRRLAGACIMLFAAATLILGGFTLEDFPGRSFVSLLCGTLMMGFGALLRGLE